MRVYADCPLLSDAGCKVARPVSSLDIGFPAVNAANHLLGYTLGGLKAIQNCDGASGVAGTFRFKIHRHPNCDAIYVACLINATTTQASTITVTAGAGTPAVCQIGVANQYFRWLGFVAPWKSTDTGTQIVTIVCANVTVASISIFDLARSELDSGDHRLVTLDPVNSGIGVIEGRYLAESDEAGPHAMVQQIKNAWTDNQPQVFAWSSGNATSRSSTSDSATNIFGTGVVIRKRLRQKRSTQTVTESAWHCYAKVTAGTYVIKVSSTVAADSATSASLSNTTFAWQTALTLDGACDQDESFTVEFQRTSGAGTIYLTDVSAIESVT